MIVSKPSNDITVILLLSIAILIIAFVGYTHNNDRMLEVHFPVGKFQEPIPVDINASGGIDTDTAWMIVPDGGRGTSGLPLQIRRDSDSAAFVAMIDPGEQTGRGVMRYMLREMKDPPESPFSIRDDGEKKVASEDFWVTIFPKDTIGRTLDVNVTVSAESSPLQLVGSKDPKGYGGFNFRPAPFVEPVISSNEGIQKDSDLRRFPWADFSAVFAGADTRSGVAIFQHGDNLNVPNGWCLRHYGFLGVSWPGNNQYLLQPGKPLHKRYRVWIHRGSAEDGLASKLFENYTNPPRAVITR